MKQTITKFVVTLTNELEIARGLHCSLIAPYPPTPISIYFSFLFSEVNLFVIRAISVKNR